MTEPVYCQFCDYYPCMCGRRDYTPKAEAKLRDQIERENWREHDAWADPYVEEGP